jgi:predicted transposase YbfD/YdcC
VFQGEMTPLGQQHLLFTPLIKRVVKKVEIEKLKAEIKEMNDPRRKWGNLRHKLEDILIIGLCSTICCGEDFVDMEEFGRDREEWLRGFLELPNGIPDSDTFRRVFEKADSKALAKGLNRWLGNAGKSGGRSVNVDGKTICGSGNAEHNAYHVLSAWVSENSITLGELAVEDKHNEITSIPELLDLIDISGDIVTIDAIGCQTDIAKKIRDKEADYVLALKDNQETLHEDVKEYFDWIEREHPKNEICDSWKSNPEKGHGRIETREILTASAQWLENRALWTDIQTLIQYRCTREIDNVKTVSVRHYISSFETSAEAFGDIIRGHWSVENQLHWMLDVVFREDGARARKDNSPLNLNILRKIALAVLKNIPIGRLSSRKKMMKAARDQNFLAQLLFKK